MSVSSPSRAPSLAALSLALALASTPTTMAARPTASALPTAVTSVAPDLRPQGGGELKFFGLPIYDGHFWSEAPEFSVTRPFALDLTYRRNIEGEKIVERSVDEISALGYGSAEERSRWAVEMRRIFPNVRKGDRLIGVNVPGRGARFFLNGKPIGEIDEPAFARAFFGIWLDPKTSRPDFRRLLLGGQ